MITIDSLIGQMKNLFAIKTPVRFDTPEYNQFHCDLIQYIYENHFEESDEWKIISRNLVYTSTQRMAVGEGNTILIQLDALKRRELGLRFAVDWKLVHLDIIRVARSLYQDGHYFESARSAFIEINARVKKLFPELRGKDGKQLDGYPLMQTVFSAKSPKIVIADTSTDTGENVQRGFMDMTYQQRSVQTLLVFFCILMHSKIFSGSQSKRKFYFQQKFRIVPVAMLMLPYQAHYRLAKIDSFHDYSLCQQL